MDKKVNVIDSYERSLKVHQESRRVRNFAQSAKLVRDEETKAQYRQLRVNKIGYGIGR